jgi:chorismate mutase
VDDDTTTIEDMADGDGEEPRRTTNMFERVRIAQEVARERAKLPADRKTWPQLAEQFGMSERALRYMHSDYVDAQVTMEDPLMVVEETLHLYTEAIEKFAQEAQIGDNASARVGATRSMLEAAKGRLELLSAVGKMPRRLGAMNDVADVHRIVHEMAKVIERHGLGQEVIVELLQIVEGEAGEPPVIEA